MRRRRGLELMVGTGLLVGPLVFALTLPRASEAPVTCEAAPVPEVVIVEACECEAEPEVEPEPEVAPASESAFEPSVFLALTDNGLVLSTDATTEWGAGRFYEPPGEATYRVAKRADGAAIPAQLWAQRGRSFDLYGADAKVCSARIGELHVINQYEGWGLDGVLGEDAWSEYDDPDDVPKRVWREALWRGEGHWLVADIVTDGDCEGALWARDAALPAPTILHTTSRETAQAAARLARFERSEMLAQTRADYEAWYAELDAEQREYEQDWATMTAQHPASAWSWVDDAGQVRLVEFDFGAPGEGCGSGFDARISALELVRSDSFVDSDQDADVTAIFDADLDGEFEYLYVDRWDWPSVELSSQTDALSFGLSIDRDFECPC